MRCIECGNSLADGQEECPSCHQPLWAFAPGNDHFPGTLTGTAQDDSFVTAPNPVQQSVLPTTSLGKELLQLAGNAIAGAVTTAQSALTLVFPPMTSVQGRVIIADSAYSEDPDLDVCRIVTRILWLIMLLPLLIGSAALCLVFRRLSPINLYATLGIFRLLNPVARNSAQEPVRYFRVRESGTDNEVMVRMKGQLTQGNIGLEDHVTLLGRYHGGTLNAKHGFNHRTASTISLARSYSWVGLLLTMLTILALVFIYHNPAMLTAGSVNVFGGAQ